MSLLELLLNRDGAERSRRTVGPASSLSEVNFLMVHIYGILEKSLRFYALHTPIYSRERSILELANQIITLMLYCRLLLGKVGAKLSRTFEHLCAVCIPFHGTRAKNCVFESQEGSCGGISSKLIGSKSQRLHKL